MGKKRRHICVNLVLNFGIKMPRYKCPNCKECLDYKIVDGNYILYCVLCNKAYRLLPRRELVYIGTIAEAIEWTM
jgi:hypothetical protein